MMIHAA